MVYWCVKGCVGVDVYVCWFRGNGIVGEGWVCVWCCVCGVGWVLCVWSGGLVLWNWGERGLWFVVLCICGLYVVDVECVFECCVVICEDGGCCVVIGFLVVRC